MTNTISKLQSEAVKIIVKILTMEPIYIKKGLPKEAIEELKLVHQRDCLVELFSDQIQKAYSNGREEVVKQVRDGIKKGYYKPTEKLDELFSSSIQSKGK